MHQVLLTRYCNLSCDFVKFELRSWHALGTGWNASAGPTVRNEHFLVAWNRVVRHGTGFFLVGTGWDR